MQGMGNSSKGNSTQDPRRKFPALKLPAEHGAVVAFLLSGIIAGQLSHAPYLFCCLFMLLWIVFLSMHNRKQSICLALVFAAATVLVSGKVILALPFVIMQTGALAILACSKRLGMSFRETAGMFGACSLPILLSVLTSADLAKAALIASAFIGSTMMGTANVRLLRPDTRVSPLPPLLVSTLFIAFVFACSNRLAVLCLLPYALQLPFLMCSKKPSFKALGIRESISLLYVTGLLTFWIH